MTTSRRDATNPIDDTGSTSNSNSPIDIELRKYAWEYFSLHADQRLRSFNFFLILAAILAGGSLTALNDDLFSRLAPAIGFYALVLCSFVFWKLDQRTRELIHHGEAALKVIEARLFRSEPKDKSQRILSIFTNEEETTAAARKGQSWWMPWSRSLSYSDCFRLVFAAVGIAGAILGTLTVLDFGL